MKSKPLAEKNFFLLGAGLGMGLDVAHLQW